VEHLLGLSKHMQMNSASSFINKHLDADLELRIAPELYLKQLIVGGFDKVYEIGKVFRNEGIDTTHNPEFTTLEFYQAYSDMNGMMDLTERLLRHIVIELFGTSKIVIPKKQIKSAKDVEGIENNILELDFDKPFMKYDVMQEVNDHFGETIDLGHRDLRLKLEGLLHSAFPQKYKENMNEKQLMDKLIEGVIEEKCVQPSYIMNHPTFMSPLAKTHPSNGLLSERFELFVDKMELVNAYSEENDATIQAENFKKQQSLDCSNSNDEEIMQTDDGYLEAMSYGMPPTGGCGVGIDRLCMLLFGQTSIREVIMFPMFRTSVLSKK